MRHPERLGVRGGDQRHRLAEGDHARRRGHAPIMRACVNMHTMADPDGELLTALDKGLPERAIGMTAAAFLAGRPRLGEFWTPLVVLDDDAMRSNVATMAGWCRERGLEIMPHGKTTMAPTLWRRQLEAGAPRHHAGHAWARCAPRASLGVDSIMLANAAVDPNTRWRYLAGELADPAFRLRVAGPTRPRPSRPWSAACAGLGRRARSTCASSSAREGGRTGARTVADAVVVAERIAALRRAAVGGRRGLRGVSGARPVAARARRGTGLPGRPDRAAPRRRAPLRRGRGVRHRGRQRLLRPRRGGVREGRGRPATHPVHPALGRLHRARRRLLPADLAVRRGGSRSGRPPLPRRDARPRRGSCRTPSRGSRCWTAASATSPTTRGSRSRGGPRPISPGPGGSCLDAAGVRPERPARLPAVGRRCPPPTPVGVGRRARPVAPVHDVRQVAGACRSSSHAASDVVVDLVRTYF